ncbi:MAG: hypothetical protein ABIH23_32030 [bacterium]
MKKAVVLAVVVLISAVSGWTATYNTSNPPTFLWLDICSNGLGDSDEMHFVIPRMEPDVFDIGVDIGADGTVDRWLSQEGTAFLGRGNADVAPDTWRHFIIRLDDVAGQQGRVVIVDKSEEYYIAVNAVRLNHADGIVVPNEVKNGYFEQGLQNWAVVESSLPQDQLIRANDGTMSMYGNHFFGTGVGSSDGGATAVIQSDVFTIKAPTSFVYGAVSGGGSEMFNNPGANSDRSSAVFLDIGSSESNLNAEYDEGVDIPLIGFYGGEYTSVRNQMHPTFWNTSGLEGKLCQIVAIDDSADYHIGLDSWSMNWDTTTIRNGGFDEGIPTPEETTDPVWYDESVALEYLEHADATPPSGSEPGRFPGWKVYAPSDGGASLFFWSKAVHGNQFSGRTYVGTAYDEAGRIEVGIKVVSDIFTIAPVPDPAESVFIQYASAQGSARYRYSPDGTSHERGAVELWVDVNGNGDFDDAADYKYIEINHNMGHNMNNSNLDVWKYPEYRWYIMPEHQGKQAIIYVEDTLGPTRGSYGWMCVDDFYVWDGAEARLCFPNSDFEEGSLNNWTPVYDINGGELGTVESGWLSGSDDSFYSGLVSHGAMNDRETDVDGDFAADTAAWQTGINGDQGTGSLTSIPFTLPTLAVTAVDDWAIFN